MRKVFARVQASEGRQEDLVLRGIESKRIWVLGRVQAPGVFPMAGPTTLLEAISMAGGPVSLTSFRDQAAAGINEELADLRRSFVVRQGALLPVDFNRLLKEGDSTQNIYLQPDDFVYVPAARARRTTHSRAVRAMSGQECRGLMGLAELRAHAACVLLTCSPQSRSSIRQGTSVRAFRSCHAR